MRKRAFTLIEVIVVVVIIALLALLAVISYSTFRAKARLSHVAAQMADIASSTAQYAQDNNNQYPAADVSRGVPPGLEKYLSGGTWPTSVWPHGVFDWDNWTIVAGQPSPQIYQISYRLCNTGDPVEWCSDPVLFPHFTQYSSIFYCLQGPCVPHQDHPTDPGYCVNCATKPVNPPL